MATSGDAYSLSTFANAFKRAFIDDDQVDIFNFDSPLLRRIKVVDGFVGTDEERVRATSFMGGYGFGSTLPRPNESALRRPRLEAKKFYVRAMLDTESIAAAMRSEGAFFELVARVKLDINRAIQNGLSLALCHSNASNELVLGVATSVAGSDPYTITLTSGDQIDVFHVGQIVTIEDGNSDLFEVTSVVKSSNQIVVGRLTGSQVPVATDEIMLQGGDGSAMTGLKAAVAQSGTLYNETIGSGWKARSTDMSGAGITEHDLFNELLEVKNECGEEPDMIVCGLTQYKKIAEQLANKRVLNDMSDEMGHRALKIQGGDGLVEIIWDRHIEDDRVYFLNSKRMMLKRRPLSGIVEHGGDILLPEYINDVDRHQIVYRLYGDFYLEPTCMALLDGLSTS